MSKKKDKKGKKRTTAIALTPADRAQGFIDEFEDIKGNIGLQRDRLDTLLSEAEELRGDCDLADDAFNDVNEALTSLRDRLSKFV